MDLEALERLGRLRTSEAISEEEFESEKRRILNGLLEPLPRASEISESSDEEITSHSDQLPDADVPRRSAGRVAVITVVTAVVLGVCGFFAYRYIAADRMEGSVSPAHYALRSQVKGIHIAALNKLPRNPHGEDSSCSVYEQAPKGRAAKAVASAGWHVTAEDTVADLNAVSFVGACTPVSATLFDAVDGNIGLYDEKRLRTVIYGKGVGHIARGADPKAVADQNRQDRRNSWKNRRYFSRYIYQKVIGGSPYG